MTLLDGSLSNGGEWGQVDRWHQKTLDEYRIKLHSYRLWAKFWVVFCRPDQRRHCGCYSFTGITGSHVPVGPAALFCPYFSSLYLFYLRRHLSWEHHFLPDHIAQSQSIFITPLLYLGGLFFPIKALPAWLHPIVKWLPTTAAFEGGRDILLNGHVLGHYLVVIWVCAILSFVLSTALFQWNMSK